MFNKQCRDDGGKARALSGTVGSVNLGWIIVPAFLCIMIVFFPGGFVSCLKQVCDTDSFPGPLECVGLG